MRKNNKDAQKEPQNQEEVKEETVAPETEEKETDQKEVPEKESKKDKKESKKEKKDQEIAELTEKLETQKNSYMRLAAEYDNYRKRTVNEKLSIYDDATAKAVEQLLPVADSMQMALETLKDAPEEVKKGMELVSQQLNKSFESLKIESFGDLGDNFNPEIHNAVSKIESEDFEENKLSQVFQKGYKIGDKVIRHAMVQVANCD